MNIMDLNNDDATCPICFEIFESYSVNYMSTQCGHKFHSTCLLKNVSKNGFSCPYCRHDMIGRNNIEISAEAESLVAAADIVESVSDSDTEEDEYSEETQIIDSEHVAARRLGMPSPYDMCVELQSRFGINMIDLMRVLLGSECTIRNIITGRIYTLNRLHMSAQMSDAYRDHVISHDVLTRTFNRLKLSFMTLIQEYNRNQEHENRAVAHQ